MALVYDRDHENLGWKKGCLLSRSASLLECVAVVVLLCLSWFLVCWFVLLVSCRVLFFSCAVDVADDDEDEDEDDEGSQWSSNVT